MTITYWLDLTLLQMGFWLTWVLIPLVVEIIPAIISSFRVLYRFHHRSKHKVPAKLPLITVIVPVYNSAKTLFACIASIANSTYPTHLIQVILADNQSTDDSFSVFSHAQSVFNRLNMQMIHTQKGKAQALNSAIYQAIGKYVINIDSDGTLRPEALMNMVLQFENEPDVAALTGAILSNKKVIRELPKNSHRILAQNEYFEYVQAFLSGRAIESEHNHLFTRSGAFSAFRREVLLQTFMYNTMTVGEDTDMTFQIRQNLKQKVVLCPNAIFYISPISGLGELYTQRQRWFRGELETSKDFSKSKKVGILSLFDNFVTRRLIIDHTFLFPRMIWFFASFVLLFFHYSIWVLIDSYLLIYLLYVFASFINYFCVRILLQEFPSEKHYFGHLWWVAWTFPIYNFICAWIRMIGAINTITRPTQWNSE